MRIKIEQAEIDQGVRDSSSLCPVALGIRGAVSSYVSISVGPRDVVLTKLCGDDGELIAVQDRDAVVLDLPKFVQVWTEQFDLWGGGRPISFSLRIPKRFQRMVNDDHRV